MSFFNETLDLWLLEMNYDSNLNCSTIQVINNTFITIEHGWNTIPEAIVLDTIMAMFMIIPFLLPCFRRCYIMNWMEFFYGDMSIVSPKLTYLRKQDYRTIESYLVHLGKKNLFSLFPQHLGTGCRKESQLAIQNNAQHINTVGSITDEELTSKVQEKKSTLKNGSFILKLRTFGENLISMKISDEQILRDKGHDAYHYLLFQRYLILLLLVWTIVSLFVILPINFTSNPQCTGFACTSIENLPFGSWKCWFHASFSIVILLLSIFLMNRFASHLRLDSELFDERRVLVIRPHCVADRDPHRDIIKDLRVFFHESHPTVKVVGLQLIFDINRLFVLGKKYNEVCDALEYAKSMSTEGNSYLVRPHGCSPWCSCCPPNPLCPESIDAVRYYSEQRDLVRNQILEELEAILKQPLNAILVEFQTQQMAMKVYKDAVNRYRGADPTIFDQIGNDLVDYVLDTVDFAPEPDDIIWTNLILNPNSKWIWKVICWITLFIIFFFLSTPAYVVELIEYNTFLKKENQQQVIHQNSPIMEFLSPLLLVLLSCMMPAIVTKVLRLIPYISMSEVNLSIMVNLFFFMVFMIIILPSAGFLTTNAMLASILAENNTNVTRFRWQCLFPSDNGAFFVIYVIHSTILTNSIEMLRIPELCLYAFEYFSVRTEAEYHKARKNIIFDFPLGVSYSQFLLIFTMTAIFGFASPLIVPAGFCYMLSKHMVDRYNIYYAYIPTKITSRIHTTAIIFVYISMILMMLQLFSVVLIKTQSSWLSKLVFLILVIILVLSFIQCYCFRVCGKTKVKRSIESFSGDVCICSYVWPVFLSLLKDNFFYLPKTNQNLNSA